MVPKFIFHFFTCRPFQFQIWYCFHSKLVLGIFYPCALRIVVADLCLALVVVECFSSVLLLILLFLGCFLLAVYCVARRFCHQMLVLVVLSSRLSFNAKIQQPVRVFWCQFCVQ